MTDDIAICVLRRDALIPNQYVVEFVDEDGEHELTVFRGPWALERAVVFASADWYDGFEDPEGLAENWHVD